MTDTTGISQKRPLDHDNNNDNNDNNNNNNNNKDTLDTVTPITTDGSMPKKKFYRSRAHCNPLSHNDTFDYPMDPTHMDWCKSHYPTLTPGTVPTILDIGCGFGGLTVALATLLPQEIVLGMEIRAKVAEYVRLRIVALRTQHKGTHLDNASVLRTNSMKFLPHYFTAASLTKLFFCFPDPHFKRKNHPRRIISERLLSEYAYYLKEGGKLYCITDVKELHDWHVEKCNAHPLFQRINDSGCEEDPCVMEMMTKTEESQKVDRAGSNKYYAVYQKIPTTLVKEVTATNFFQ